jgi:hypothetical protein
MGVLLASDAGDGGLIVPQMQACRNETGRPARRLRVREAEAPRKGEVPETSARSAVDRRYSRFSMSVLAFKRTD